METYYRLLVTLPLSLGAEAGYILVAVAMEMQEGTHLGKSGCGQFAHVCVSGLLHCLRVVVGGGAPWCEHVDDIIEYRRGAGRHLLPEGFFLESGVLNLVGVGQGSAGGKEERILFNESKIRLQGPPSEGEEGCGGRWAVALSHCLPLPYRPGPSAVSVHVRASREGRVRLGTVNNAAVSSECGREPHCLCSLPTTSTSTSQQVPMSISPTPTSVPITRWRTALPAPSQNSRCPSRRSSLMCVHPVLG